MSLKEPDLDQTLDLPFRGKVYSVEPADIDTGILCQRLMSTGAKAASGREINETDVDKLGDAEEEDLYKRLLGPIWDEMRADGLRWVHLKHAGTTAMIWAAMNRESAEAFFEKGGDVPKAPKTPQDRKPSKRTPTASRAGSTKKALPAKKAASAGKTSSTTSTS